MLNGVAVALYGETDFLRDRSAENAGCCRELSRASRNNARNVPVFDVFRAFGDEFGGLSGAIDRSSHLHPAMPSRDRSAKELRLVGDQVGIVCERGSNPSLVTRDFVLLNKMPYDFTPPVDTMTTLSETAAFVGNANLEAVVMPGRLATNRPAKAQECTRRGVTRA